MKEKVIQFFNDNPRAKSVAIFAVAALILFAIFG